MRFLTLAFVLTATVVFAQQQVPPAQQQGRPGMVDPRAPAADAKATAVIRGRVVSADTGRPLRHATITVIGEDIQQITTTGLLTTTTVTSQSTYTDENGLFQQAKLSPGKYRVRASLVGYVTLEYGEDPESGGGQQITIAENERFDKADFRLPRGGAIAGRIVDEAGEPLEGVQVQALTLQYVAGMERLTPVASGATTAKRSNDLGQYRIFGLQPGEYYVAATPGAFNTSAPTTGDMAPGYAVTYYPGTIDVAGAQKVTVSAGQEAPADFAVALSRVFDLSGVVLDATGRPVETGLLLLYPGTQASIGIVARTATRQEGAFRFAGVPAGTYLLQLQPSPLTSMPMPQGTASAPPSFASMVVTVGANSPPVTVQARAGRTAVGDVVVDGGGSLDMNVSSVRLSVRPADFTKSPTIGLGNQTRVNADGTFELRNLWGPCVVNVSVPRGWGLKAVRAGGADVTDLPIDFDRNPGRLQIVLTNQLTEISGGVMDQGRPSVRTPVLVFATDAARWDFPSRYVRLVNTDDNGHFSLSGMPASDYHVVALSRIKSGTAWQRPDFLEPLTRSSVRIQLQEGERRSVDLRVQ